jgi:hypothetical protein
MFIDCPYCGFLVALDERGERPPRCPNCAQRLREDATPGASAADVGDTATGNAEDAASERLLSGSVQDRSALATESAGDASRSIATDASEQLPVAAVPQAAAQHDAEVIGRTSPAAAALSHDDASHDAPHLQAASATAMSVSATEEIATVPSAAEAIAQTAREAQDDERAQAAVTPASPDTPSHGAEREMPSLPPEPDVTSTPAIDADAASYPTPETLPDLPPVAVEPDAAADAAPAPAALTRRARPTSVPSFVRRSSAVPASRRRRSWEIAIVAALTLLLGLQLLLSQRARLAEDAQWRPLLTPLCAALRCALPPWREPGAFRVLERDVRAHAPGVLRVSARIRNDARWAQPWPVLRLTLSDADGRAVASRLFQPREYLGGAPTQMQLGSGQSAALRMDIVEPGPQAVAFTFDFQ